VRTKRLGEESLTPATNIYFQPSPQSVRTLTLKVGDHVRHSKFGAGIVMNCNSTKDDQELTVVFEGAGVKKLLASLAPLEKIKKDFDFSS
jgi:DNA helicase-2/ATP-dependent DNA helicase PcrA